MRPIIREAIARIEICDGDQVVGRGTGFLVTESLVLTALHVVGDRKSAPLLLYEQQYQVVLCFPGCHTHGRVLDGYWSREGDWTLVQCTEPPNAVPLPLAELDTLPAIWETFGFPDANPTDGMVHSGSVENPLGDLQGIPAMQLFSWQAAAGNGSPVCGLSGAPVIVNGAVVGLLRYSLMQDGLNVAGTLYACPVSTIIERCAKVLPLPDSCWGLPGLPWRDLPQKPFRYLSWFTEDEAELFFGRRREIREFYDQLTAPETAPIIFLYGQSGVGKSSFLAAGIVPRLRWGHSVVYIRRNAETGLTGCAEAALSTADVSGISLEDLWRQRERKEDRPLIAFVDQLEEVYTHPNPQLHNELDDFVRALAGLFSDRTRRPAGRIVLSFRKEWYPEIAKKFETAGLPHSNMFLERLTREGILDAITGLTTSRRMRNQYGLTIDDNLPLRIADDLCEDWQSPIATTLQLLLTKLWEEATARNPNRPHFDGELYRNLKSQGFRLADFVRDQLTVLATGQQTAVDSGLVLDLLASHTTILPSGILSGTEWTEANLQKIYAHCGEHVTTIIQSLRDLFLLVDSSQDRRDGARASRLAHDTLVPVVRRMVALSDLPAQRARRILETRATEWVDGRLGTPLDERDLAIVEGSLSAMRALSPDEDRLLHASQDERRKKAHTRRLKKGVSVLGVVVLLFALAFGWKQYRNDSIRQSIANAGGRLYDDNGHWGLWFDKDANADIVLHHLYELPPLEEADLGETRLTDKGARSLEGAKRLQTLSLGKSKISGDGLVYIANLHELRSLDLQELQLRDQDLRHLVGLRRLEKLNLSQNSITDKGLIFLSALSNLRELTLSDNRAIQGSGLTSLRELKHLEKLTLDGTGVTEIEGLSGHAKLRTLSLRLTGMSNKRLKAVMQLPNLEELTLNGTGVTEIEGLSGHAKLRTLHLFSTRMSNKGLKAVMQLPNLEELTLSKTSVTAIEGLSGHAKLRVLTLESSVVTNAGLKAITQLPSLQELWLGSSQQVSDEGLKYIGRVTALRLLSMPNTGISDYGLVHLKNLSQLQELYLGGTAVTDVGLEYVRELPALKTLWLLLNRGITDKGLTLLRSVTTLQELCLDGTTITENGVQALQAHLPKAKISTTCKN